MGKGLHNFMALAMATAFFASACGDKGATPPPATDTSHQCAPKTLASGLAAKGKAAVFLPDPVIKSGTDSLSPTSLKLDEYRSFIELDHLDGKGVLASKYVDIRDGLTCKEEYGSFSEKNDFTYNHSDDHFQEAMSYYFGDTYRANLDSAAILAPAEAVRIVAHCMKEDNAYFERHTDRSTGKTSQKVCLGDSETTEGASYADDATVVIHELQHATTINTYSTVLELNRFWYDEAGSLNEAVSDFMALSFLDPMIAAPFDPRLFSRWALGTFIPNHSGARGANQCPVYDSKFPDCSNFPGFSADNNTVSFVYPDGMGWSFANNFVAPGYVKSAFTSYHSQEEIHNAATVLSGSLWDAYALIKANHSGDWATAQRLMAVAVTKAVANLPKPTLSNQSPVTYRGFASTLVAVAPVVGFDAKDAASLTDALTKRGLYGTSNLIASDWAAVPSDPSSAVKIQDNPSVIKKWFSQMGTDPEVVKQGITTGLNGKLDPGEIVAVWFNIQNTRETTAGGLMVTVTSKDSEVTLLDENFNIGAISGTQAQIRYSKINGTSIVTALKSANETFNVPTGNTYFLTNPFFDRTWFTAIFVQVSSTATKGKTVNLELKIEPSNGPTQTLTFPVTINGG